MYFISENQNEMCVTVEDYSKKPRHQRNHITLTQSTRTKITYCTFSNTRLCSDSHSYDQRNKLGDRKL